jgi:zinc D-Ala-D-Ala carboxypeptidase
MKKWGFILFGIIVIGFTVLMKEAVYTDKLEIQENQVRGINSEASGREEAVAVTEEQVHKGSLLLVNNDYPIQRESIKSDIVDLFARRDLTKGFGLLEADIRLSEEVAHEFSKMIDAAAGEGISHFMINSGYREFDEQTALYQEMGSDYALPAGYSEHNLGLSLDVGSSEDTMYNAPEGKWIEENAWKYGFILRYPKDKTEVTGIQYEPWHIRYVGLPHSAIMKEKGFVLEEYLQYLQDERSITASYDGKTYTITYYPASEAAQVNVPEDADYEISGDNMDGIIVTAIGEES